jgi:hypothetical protein
MRESPKRLSIEEFGAYRRMEPKFRCFGLNFVLGDHWSDIFVLQFA